MELRDQAEERFIAAAGTAAAIADVFSGKKVLAKFRKQLAPRSSPAAATDSDAMSVLRRRIHGAMDIAGALAEASAKRKGKG